MMVMQHAGFSVKGSPKCQQPQLPSLRAPSPLFLPVNYIWRTYIQMSSYQLNGENIVFGLDEI